MSSAFHRGGSKSSDREHITQSGAPRPTWKDSEWKNYTIAAIGEFVGTFLFLFFAFGGAQTASIAHSHENNQGDTFPSVSLLLYIAFAFGLSLAVNVWIFFRVSGGLFNPAVTFGFVLLGVMPIVKGVIVFISQILGATLAAGLIDALLPRPLGVNTTLGGGISIAQGLFLEVFLTFELVFTIYLLAVEKHRATFMAPLVIGLSLFIAHLTGIYFTGASLNPARSIGPAIVTGEFPGYHWIYWVGPGLGSILATLLYKFLLFAEYKTANPGQDDDGLGHIPYASGGGLDRTGEPGSSQTGGSEQLV